MKVKIVTIGKVKQPFVEAGEEMYLERLRSKVKLSFRELEPATNLPEPEMKRAEGEAVLSEVQGQDLLVVLDERGEGMSSEAFAKKLQRWMVSGKSSLVFALGGAFGHDEKVRAKADLVLSLSPLTFTYQMARLILVEQLYRAMSIIDGSPYHKK
jgi:23S rRNA (pseudouridine1915-N3)-methyltransferase